MTDQTLSGLTLLSFESRRAAEIAQLISGYGGTAVSAPSLREVPLAENAAVREFFELLDCGAVDVVIFLTGVGTNALIEILAPRCPVERFSELLRKPTVIARGPKPRAALRAIGREPDHNVPEPNTWRELLTTVEQSCSPLSGKTVAVQEYGQSNDELLAALRGRGARVLAVPVYRWALPEDVEPLRDGLRAIVRGDVDIALFTSAQQCTHVLQVARDLGLEQPLRDATATMAIASVGPICSEALRAADLPVDIEPAKPKMGPLIREVATMAHSVLDAKRQTR